jgi:hypothetical protein
MRDVAKWIRETLASRREANRPPPGNVILGAALSGVIAERANHGLPVVTLGTERLIDGDGAPIRVFEDERAAAILFVGGTTEPSPGAALLASDPITPYTRPLRQAPLPVEELATAKQGSEFTVRLPGETP